MLVPPMKNNMPIYNTYANVAQRLRNYVANGNHIIFTGGSLVSIEFLNRYFWYNIEPVSAAGTFKGSGYGNWSPGPFRKLINDDLPWVYKLTPDTLYQVLWRPVCGMGVGRGVSFFTNDGAEQVFA